MASNAEVCVGIDIGTSSVKAVAVDRGGDVVARARIRHRLLVPAADRLEHDPMQAWRRGPRRALATLGLPAAPRGVSVSAMVPSLAAVDARGHAAGPGLLYGDARGRTGSGGGEAGGFLRWLAAEHPDASGFWPAQAVANHALGGPAAVDRGTAFSTYPLYGPSGWDVDVLAGAGVTPGQLPAVAGEGEPIGSVGDAVLGSGSVDAMAEQLVAGATQPGDVLVVCGTTLIVWANAEDDRAVEGLLWMPGRPGRPAVVGGASNAGGLFLDWVARLLAPGRREPAPGDVPVLLPYVRGERTPYDDPDLRASVHGLALTHGAAGLRRGAFEASAFAARHLLERTGVAARRIVAVGGGTRSAAWMQALADATCLPVDVAAVPEGAALGAAWLGAMAAGLESSATDAERWARTSHRVEPRPDWVGPVAERYAAFSALSPDA